jgi:hypothetical protein
MVVAIGVAFIVGILEMTTSRDDDRYTISLTLDTQLLQSEADRLRSKVTTSVAPSATGDEAGNLEMTGRVMAVRHAANELVVSENVKSWTFHLAKDARVFINDRAGTLAEVQAGDTATVNSHRQGDKLIATMVRSTRK